MTGNVSATCRYFGITRQAGKAWPDWETYDRIERLFGWPRSFATQDTDRP